MTFKAEGLFDAQVALGVAESNLWDFLVDVSGDENVGGCDDVTFDYYDHSFELKECPPAFRWPADRLEPLWEAGFLQFWINHTDGTETWYSKQFPTGNTHKRAEFLAKGEGQAAEPSEPQK